MGTYGCHKCALQHKERASALPLSFFFQEGREERDPQAALPSQITKPPSKKPVNVQKQIPHSQRVVKKAQMVFEITAKLTILKRGSFKLNPPDGPNWALFARS